MSISAYVGLPGSGKSYGVFENVILPALKEGRSVYANIPVHEEKLIKDYNVSVIPYETSLLTSNPSFLDNPDLNGAIFVIDECQRVWPSGMKANAIPESHRNFLSEHRHRVGDNSKSIEIILLTQDLTNIASYPRGLVETTYRSVDLSVIGKAKNYRIDIFQGSQKGPDYPKKTRVRSLFGKYKSDVYQYYISHTSSLSDQAGDESKIDGRANIFKSFHVKSIPFLILAFILILYMFIRSYNSFFRGNDESESVSSNNLVPSQSSTSSSPVLVKFDYLNGYELSIVFNRGIYPNIHYSIRATKGDDYFTLNNSELLRLGYTLKPVNDCLVKLLINKTEYVAVCRSLPDPNESEGGLSIFTSS